MLRKFFTGFLLCSFLMVHTEAATGDSLKAVFDEFNYAVQVEWDQKDKTFYNAQVEKLKSKLEVMKANDLTDEELLNAALLEVKDQSLVKEIRTALSLMHIGQLSKKEVQDMIIKTAQKSQATGASWEGKNEVLMVVGVLAVVAIVAIIALHDPCPEGTTNTTVGYQEVCGYDSYCDEWGYCSEYYSCHQQAITECL